MDRCHHRFRCPEELPSALFLVAHALRLGVSADVPDGGRFRAPLGGVRVPSQLPDSLLLRCRAALLLHPSAAVSHANAAMLRGLPVPRDAQPDEVELCVPVGERAPRLHGVRGHTGLRPDDAVLLRSGVRAVRADRMWATLADRLGVDDLVVLGDAILRRGLADLGELSQMASGGRYRRGLRLLRQAVPLLEPRTDSPMETRLRLLIVRAGLPRPVANRDVVVDGDWLARPDLSYPDLRIAVEYDGDQHRSRRRWRSDRARRHLLEDAGWIVLQFTANDVVHRPVETVERIRRAIISRTHFPGSASRLAGTGR